MSTQFDQVFDGLSKNSLTLEDACRALYTELQASPESMRVCCERIETELSQGRISSDAAQLLLDALGEHGSEDNSEDSHGGEEVWVDVPLESLASEAPRPAAFAAKSIGTDTITEVDLTMDDLLAALDRRGPVMTRTLPEVDFEIGDELAAPVEWVEWEPESPEPPSEQAAGLPPQSESPVAASSAIAPGADDVGATIEVDLALLAAANRWGEAIQVEQAIVAEPAVQTEEVALAEPAAQVDEFLLAEPAVQSEEAALAAAAAEIEEAALAVPAVQVEGFVLDEPATRVEEAVHAEAEAGPVVQREQTASETTEQSEHFQSSEAKSEAGSIPAAPSIADAAQHGSDAVFAPRFEHVLKESSPIQLGTLLNGRYRILAAVEPGGLGQLLDAIDTRVPGGPRVTLKMIEVDWQEEPRAFETLQAIVRHVRRLRHPNVLSILDIDRDDKHAIIAMEPLRGRWLSGLLREVRGRGLGFAVSWNIISGIANGLAYAHQHGAVHAELNPHMVFLTEDGAVKIAGFGLAQAIPMSMEPIAVLDGLTLRSYADAYSATNWVHGSTPQGVDDLYPLGVIAYELLTGAHPFNRLSPAVAAARQLQPSQIPGLDRRIRKVIECCLSFDRQERPVNGANFLAHIEPSEQLLELVRERFKRPAEDHLE